MSEQQGDMKIIAIKAENVRSLKIAELHPDGKHVVVGGLNAQGKSSLIDSVCIAVGGKKAAPDRPIRDGQEALKVDLDLGAIRVKRTITEKTDRAEVTSKEGLAYPSPQKFLDSLYSKVAFDPMSFMDRKPEEQATLLRELCGIDTSALDMAGKAAYDNRTEVNRDLKAAKARLDSAPLHLDAPYALIVVSDLAAEIAAITEKNAKVAEVAGKVDAAKETVVKWRAHIDALKAKIAEAEVNHTKAVEYERKVSAAATARPVDVAPLVARMQDAERLNEMVRDMQARKSLQSEVDALTQKSEDYTAEIEKVQSRRAEMLSKAKMPIDGLSIADDGVTFKGHPLGSCSQSEQLLALGAIGAALNPRMRFCILRDASVLDRPTRERFLKEMAARNVQVVAEVVGDDDGVTVVMEAGAVLEQRTIAPEPVPEAAPVVAAEPEDQGSIKCSQCDADIPLAGLDSEPTDAAASRVHFVRGELIISNGQTEYVYCPKCAKTIGNPYVAEADDVDEDPFADAPPMPDDDFSMEVQ